MRAPSTRRIVPEVEAIIDAAWSAALARPGVHLFDGPMCRLESFRVSPQRLELSLSDTSYKPFFGTHLSHPELFNRFGPEVMSNSVGVSPALLSSDGFLMLGRRNQSVAYYPGRVHPFSGSLEPREQDVFGAVRRELREELSLADADIAQMVCTGIAEDLCLRHPELMFAVTATRTREQIERQLDPVEHHDVWSTPGGEAGVAAALGQRDQLTPIAIASLLLWGRLSFGDAWFAQRSVEC